jgi:predicted HicB family RNase H-like nuclease
MQTSKPKPKKPGRPRLAKEEAKGKTVLVRFKTEDAKRIEKEAKAKKQTVSEWVRNTLLATIGG